MKCVVHGCWVSILVALFFVSVPHAQCELDKVVMARAYADADDQEAQLQLARSYLTGDWFPRDRVMAYFWFSVAASTGGSRTRETGAQEAKSQLEKLDKSLPPTQIAQAEAMIRDWKPKEILESEPLKRIFASEFNTVLVLSIHGYKEYRKGEVTHLKDVDFWPTQFWLPGASSKRCEASELSEPQNQGVTGIEFLRCNVYSSPDIEAARATFQQASQYVWDLLPIGWYRGPTSPSLRPVELDLVCFSAERFGFGSNADSLPRGSVKIALSLGPSAKYIVQLEFGTRGACDISDPYRAQRKGDQAAQHLPNTPPSTNSEILNRIDGIARSGRFLPLPIPQIVSNANSASPSLTIGNNTVYTLTLYLSGPSDQTLVVGSGRKERLILTTGRYRLAGTVSDPSVMPFYGEQTFTSGDYSEDFYVGTK